MLLRTVGELNAIQHGNSIVTFMYAGQTYNAPVPPEIERIVLWYGLFPVAVTAEFKDSQPLELIGVVDIEAAPQLEELDWKLGDPIPENYQTNLCDSDWV